MLRLRQLILDAAPFIEEKFEYHICIYYRYSWVFYLTWNPKRAEVDLGFNRGFELSNEQGLLEAKKRKVVKTIAFQTLSDVNQKQEALKEIIQEAILLDEIAHQQKKKKSKWIP